MVSLMTLCIRSGWVSAILAKKYPAMFCRNSLEIILKLILEGTRWFGFAIDRNSDMSCLYDDVSAPHYGTTGATCRGCNILSIWPFELQLHYQASLAIISSTLKCFGVRLLPISEGSVTDRC